VAVIIYGREQGLWRFGQNLDSEDGGERSMRGYLGDPLVHEEKPRAIHKFIDKELVPCEGLLKDLGLYWILVINDNSCGLTFQLKCVKEKLV
jgi:hypothetical protein